MCILMSVHVKIDAQTFVLPSEHITRKPEGYGTADIMTETCD